MNYDEPMVETITYSLEDLIGCRSLSEFYRKIGIKPYLMKQKKISPDKIYCCRLDWIFISKVLKQNIESLEKPSAYKEKLMDKLSDDLLRVGPSTLNTIKPWTIEIVKGNKEEYLEWHGQN